MDVLLRFPSLKTERSDNPTAPRHSESGAGTRTRRESKALPTLPWLGRAGIPERGVLREAPSAR